MAFPIGWAAYKGITVQDTNVDANLTDFPCYVKLDADAEFSKARADGYDIRFTLSDGITLLKYEREYWTGGNGSAATAHFWVKVPSILASGGATIKIWYGKSDASDGEDAANVWDANFKGVWHLKDDPDTSTVQDSTTNNNDGNKGAANEPIEATGKIWKGQDFDGADDMINCGSDASVDNQEPFTISAWIYADSAGEGSNGTILTKMSTGWNTGVWKFGFTAGAVSDHRAHFVKEYSAADLDVKSEDNDVSLSNWHHMTMTWDGSATATNVHIYRNNTELGYTKQQNGVDVKGSDAVEQLIIGNRGDADWSFEGIIDELRFSSKVREAAWIKFEFYNMNEADNELTWGDEVYARQQVIIVN